MSYSFAFLTQNQQTAEVNFAAMQQNFKDKKQLTHFLDLVDTVMAKKKDNQTMKQVKQAFHGCLSNVVVENSAFEGFPDKKSKAIKKAANFCDDMMDYFYARLNKGAYQPYKLALEDLQDKMLQSPQNAAEALSTFADSYRYEICKSLSSTQQDEMMDKMVMPMVEVMVCAVRNIAGNTGQDETLPLSQRKVAPAL